LEIVMKKPLLSLLLLLLGALCGCNEGKSLLVDRGDLAVAAPAAAR
jgi:hypothetical protein